MVTVALGTAAPAGSRIVPPMLPKISWAGNGRAASSRSENSHRIILWLIVARAEERGIEASRKPPPADATSSPTQPITTLLISNRRSPLWPIYDPLLHVCSHSVLRIFRGTQCAEAHCTR